MNRANVAPAPQGRPVTLDELYAMAGDLNMAAGWVSREAPIMGSQERSKFHPQLWTYEQARRALEAAGSLIDVALAERRNLILRNDITDNEWATSRTLVCAYQMIMPGETAPSHRHTSNALRVIIDSTGSYSIVDGVKMPMESGDVVLTPSGHWHGHGHEGSEPAYWLDCLDVPLTYLLEPMYYEHHPAKYEPVVATQLKSPYRFSRADIARELDRAVPHEEGLHGAQVALPTPSMPTVGLRAQRLESGRQYRRHRSSANRIFSVMHGSGRTRASDLTLSWSRGDTFVIPSSHWMQHTAQEDALLLEITDEPLMRYANHYRFEMG